MYFPSYPLLLPSDTTTWILSQPPTSWAPYATVATPLVHARRCSLSHLPKSRYDRATSYLRSCETPALVPCHSEKPVRTPWHSFEGPCIMAPGLPLQPLHLFYRRQPSCLHSRHTKLISVSHSHHPPSQSCYLGLEYSFF